MNRSSATALVAVTLLHLLAAEASAQLVVTPGSDPAATLKGAVRFRNFSSAGTENEVWVGTPPLAAPPVSAGTDVPWHVEPRIGFGYDPDAGLLSVSATDFSNDVPITLAYVEKAIGNVGAVNYVEITITTQVPEAHMFVAGALDPPGSSPFGSCAGCFVVGKPGEAAGTFQWRITGTDLTEGFGFTGRVAAGYPLAVGEADFVEIAFGYLPPPDTAGPQVSNLSFGPTPFLLNGIAALTATINDLDPRHTSISSAVYTLNGSTMPLSAVDGAFDSPSEAVALAIPLTRIGVNDVCVRATDSLNNTGPASCQQFIVTYKFTGFFSPVDTSAVNDAVAGQTVPLRWRLTDANGIPASDPQWMQQLVVYQISCTDLDGRVTDAIEEYAAGGNGLIDLGDGKWQFNFKTSTSYAGSCRAVYLPLANGVASPIVAFNFR